MMETRLWWKNNQLDVGLWLFFYTRVSKFFLPDNIIDISVIIQCWRLIHIGKNNTRFQFWMFSILEQLLHKVSFSEQANRVTKTPSARQQCWPESFCKYGKFLRQVHYWLKNFRILCNTKYPDNMQSVRMNWKVSGQSKKCLDNLENVSG